MDAGARLSDQDGALNDVPKDKANLAGIPAAACPRKRSAAVVDLEKLLDIKLSRKPSFAEVLSSARRSSTSSRESTDPTPPTPAPLVSTRKVGTGHKSEPLRDLPDSPRHVFYVGAKAGEIDQALVDIPANLTENLRVHNEIATEQDADIIGTPSSTREGERSRGDEADETDEVEELLDEVAALHERLQGRDEDLRMAAIIGQRLLDTQEELSADLETVREEKWLAECAVDALRRDLEHATLRCEQLQNEIPRLDHDVTNRSIDDVAGATEEEKLRLWSPMPTAGALADPAERLTSTNHAEALTVAAGVSATPAEEEATRLRHRVNALESANSALQEQLVEAQLETTALRRVSVEWRTGRLDQGGDSGGGDGRRSRRRSLSEGDAEWRLASDDTDSSRERQQRVTQQSSSSSSEEEEDRIHQGSANDDAESMKERTAEESFRSNRLAQELQVDNTRGHQLETAHIQGRSLGAVHGPFLKNEEMDGANVSIAATEGVKEAEASTTPRVVDRHYTPVSLSEAGESSAMAPDYCAKEEERNLLLEKGEEIGALRQQVAHFRSEAHRARAELAIAESALERTRQHGRLSFEEHGNGGGSMGGYIRSPGSDGSDATNGDGIEGLTTALLRAQVEELTTKLVKTGEAFADVRKQAEGDQAAVVELQREILALHRREQQQAALPASVASVACMTTGASSDESLIVQQRPVVAGDDNPLAWLVHVWQLLRTGCGGSGQGGRPAGFDEKDTREAGCAESIDSSVGRGALK